MFALVCEFALQIWKCDWRPAPLHSNPCCTAKWTGMCYTDFLW